MKIIKSRLHLQENGNIEPGCWFDTTMSSSVSDFLILKSSMNSNTTHYLDIAVAPAFEKAMLSMLGTFRRSYDPPLHVRGVWMKRGQEDQSTQFQLFSVEFNDLKDAVSEDILPLIYRSYIRLQSYCPVVRKRRRKRGPKVFRY